MLSTPAPRHRVGSRRSLALVAILLGMAVSFTARVGAQQPAQDGSARPGTPTTAVAAPQPHLESPQFRQVMQPSISTTAAVLHFGQS